MTVRCRIYSDEMFVPYVDTESLDDTLPGRAGDATYEMPDDLYAQYKTSLDAFRRACGAVDAWWDTQLRQAWKGV